MAPSIDHDDPLSMPSDADVDIVAQEIILAASRHDVATLRTLLRTAQPLTSGPGATAANVQDPETGYSPLHAAIVSLAPSDPANGDGHESLTGQADDKDDEVQRATKTIRVLLENGAIWNMLDAQDETPGCVAHRLGLKEPYEMIVDAGVRAELLFQRLDEVGYEVLEDDDEADNDDNEAADADTLEAIGRPEISVQDAANDDNDQAAEANRPNAFSTDDPTDTTLSNPSYLSSRLTFTSTRLLDADSNGVMMDWEKDIMAQTVSQLLPTAPTTPPHLTVLNIGHGLGIIDTLLQSHTPRPTSHHIIEAHPAVLERLRAPNGFLATHPNVTLHEGRWQDVLPLLVAQDLTFDAIYFDTFAEDYSAFRTFFSKWVIALLKPEGRWSFFHGLGADRRVCYDVYTKVAEMDLFEAGFDVEWSHVGVPDLRARGEWDGVRRAYWAVDEYRLPVCSFMG